jgi:DNA-binding transcriptional regulator YiaG
MRVHETHIGRYTVKDGGISDAIPDGLTDEQLGTLERRAAITVLRDVRSIEGAELRDARRILGLKQTELAEHLAVTPETVSRWETGGHAFDRSVQLAVLAMLEHVHRGLPLELPKPVRGFQLRIAC